MSNKMKARANQCTLENIQIFSKKLSRRGNEQVTKNSNRCKEKHKDKKKYRGRTPSLAEGT